MSAIIPTFNRAHLLPRAVDSILSQTLPPHSVIIVDDGSTDGTEKLIKKNYPEIKYLKQDNLGVSAARNAGITATSCEWLAFLDSDDEWLPEKLARQMEVLNLAPAMKICHSDEIWIRNGKRVNPLKKHSKSGGWMFKKALPICCISPSSAMIHRSVFDNVGLFEESLPACEDYDLWLRVTSSYPVLYISEKLVVKHGGHQNQLSEKYWGMDRFRIQALENIILSGNLSDENLNDAKQMLQEKTKIFSNGARKRGRTAEAEKCEQRMEAILG
ncbi:MAG TPA: glycosyltransferase family 2 protein [Candidatus Marinimicrobia bacterium]|nr:glycosyltransferase family 2 protein [Candidatus Neomarinimicrobiota bacterium]HHZ98132.1 glycosyltransferase family 2 protein [Candidatus Neomarinimicrobiota bacterium]HIB02264.1 glycosyltransferase family 2 protein [Candidatus Neomarinimicrobiota bacterium]HIB71764.1 glycosyltransferase family 2 protein [Candidatus Neomarinimicrobiota bacterium]HIB96301.1 glycosyltransferase family 2 protein [Candidatus Neomarinimicrobiota bacterium]